jgi:hypothetical protein
MVQIDYTSGGGHVNMIDDAGKLESLVMPTQLVALIERPSFSQQLRGSRAALYIDGGLNAPSMVTDQRMILRRYIRPMPQPLIETATPAVGQIGLEQVAGTGPKGLCIFYLRWEDSTNQRLSGFSAASPTLDLSGLESVKFRGVPPRPVPDDFPVDKVQVWVSRNGAAKRRLARRDTGVSTFTITESIEYETETVDGLQELPRCLFNAVYHDRLWTAGDAANLDRIYFSPPERLSEYAGGYLITRNGEAVVGLCQIRDVLVVFCANSSYYISGYSEDDFSMHVLEPNIGAVTHHGIKMVNGYGIVPSRTGFYACSGTSMRYISSGHSNLWREMYASHPERFELGFGVTDEKAKVYKFFEEDVTLSANGTPNYGTGRYWVLDYADSVLDDGQGEPLLSYDLHAARPKCAAMVAAPGGKAGDCYTTFTAIYSGGAQNRIVKENVGENLDAVGDYTTVIQPGVKDYEPEGGPHDGITAVEGWILVHFQSIASWLLEMLHGPDRAMIRSNYSWALNVIFGMPQAAPPASGGGREITPGWGSWTPADTQNFSPAALPFKIGLTGEGFGPRLSVLNPKGLVWSGWGFTSEAGKAYLAKHV